MSSERWFLDALKNTEEREERERMTTMTTPIFESTRMLARRADELFRTALQYAKLTGGEESMEWEAALIDAAMRYAAAALIVETEG